MSAENEAPKVELTERELAIAQGGNPDAIPVASPPERTDGGTDAVEQPGTDASPSGGGQEAASSTVSWLNDTTRALGKSYGFSEDELSEFKDEADFTRAARILDRQFAAFGQAARQPIEQQQTQQQPAAAAATPAEQKPAAQAPATLPRVDIEKLKKQGWDEETIAELAKQNQLAEHLESQRAALEQERAQTQQIAAQFGAWQQHVQQMQAQEEAYNFHSAVDSLGDPRFGKAFDANGQLLQLTNEQHAQRKKLYDARLDIETGHMARGAAPPPMQIAVQRARNYAFAEEIRAEERARVQKEIAAQSAKRRPVAQQPRNAVGQYAPAPPKSPDEAIRQLIDNPAIVDAWNRVQQHSGAAV